MIEIATFEGPDTYSSIQAEYVEAEDHYDIWLVRSDSARERCLAEGVGRWTSKHHEMPRDESNDGCPMCDWDGYVATTHDYDHTYYTHIAVVDGELLKGKTCSMRTQPRRPGLLGRVLWYLRGDRS